MTITWVSRQLTARADGHGDDRLGVVLLGGVLSVVVCDGAGGIPGASRAAELACASILRGLPAAPVDLLLAADRVLETDALAGESTAVLATSSPAGAVVGASCGDSVAFLGHQEATIGQHRKRRLGSGRALPVPFGGKADRVLLCTDGLLGILRPAQITEILTTERHPERAADRLVRGARLPSGALPDDLALVLVSSSA